MTEQKKYPCLYDLIDDCAARKLVEENMLEPKENLPEAKALEKAVGKTHILQFDDDKTAERMGREAARGSLHVLKPLKPQFMISFCSMCPTRAERIEEVYRKCRQQPQTEKVTTPFSDKKKES